MVWSALTGRVEAAYAAISASLPLHVDGDVDCIFPSANRMHHWAEKGWVSDTESGGCRRVSSGHM